MSIIPIQVFTRFQCMTIFVTQFFFYHGLFSAYFFIFLLKHSSLHPFSSIAFDESHTVWLKGHPSTVMFQLARKDSLVELVELHQLDEICESCVAIIQGVEHLTIIFHLQQDKQQASERTAMSEQANILKQTKAGINSPELQIRFSAYYVFISLNQQVYKTKDNENSPMATLPDNIHCS